MKVTEHERRDWIIVLIIMLFGLLIVILAGQWALVFAPSWRLNADMGSKLNIDRNLLANRPDTIVEAIDPSVLTQPVWINVFLTPGAAIPTRIRSTPTLAPPPTSTHGVVSSPTEPTPTPTATILYFLQTSTATSNPAFTKTSTPKPSPTATVTRTSTATRTFTPTFTPTNIPLPQADLRITITDNASDYDAGHSIQYTIVASNPVGPSGVTSASITASFSANLSGVSWSCMPAAAASCTANGAGNINDSVNLPVGTSVTYTVSATVVASPAGALVSMAMITPPASITETGPGDNSATDTDTLIIPDPIPPQIGTGPDNNIYVVQSKSVLTIQFSSPLVVGGHSGWDLIYYEWPQASPDPMNPTNPGIWMDCVTLQVGDGANWYTILNWGDNKTDANASMNMDTIHVSTETDNLVVDASLMYNATGIAIELDGVVPSGKYPYFRIISPGSPPDDGDGAEVDGIYIVP